MEKQPSDETLQRRKNSSPNQKENMSIMRRLRKKMNKAQAIISYS